MKQQFNKLFMFCSVFTKIVSLIVIVSIVFLCHANLVVIKTTKNSITESVSTDDYDCIIVLGAGVRSNGKPSNILYDRVITGVNLYKDKAAPKIIMSGDHGRINYDEVNTMKKLATDNGVNSADVFMDHAGFSTYDTFYRARDVFGVKKAIIVTQEYHLYRALYIAKKLGIECVGVSADLREYRGRKYRLLREYLARSKDYLSCIIKPKPKYLGELIPVSGDGNATND